MIKYPKKGDVLRCYSCLEAGYVCIEDCEGDDVIKSEKFKALEGFNDPKNGEEAICALCGGPFIAIKNNGDLPFQGQA